MLIPPPKCPDCGHELSWQDLKRSFECPNCRVHLKSNYYGVMFWALAVLPFPFTIFVALGGIPTILIGCATLAVLSIWILAKCITVRRG
jgi:rubredoxin